jgi:alpha-amylase
MPSDKAVVFLQNHDTQHDCGISYKDGSTFRLGQRVDAGAALRVSLDSVELRLQLPGRQLGRAAVGREREHQIRWSAAPRWRRRSSASGSASTAIPTSGTWWGFRRLVAGTDINHWWDDGDNTIAFSRGDKGFVSINNAAATVQVVTGTGLPQGTYCDLLTGGKVGSSLRGDFDRGRCRR